MSNYNIPLYQQPYPLPPEQELVHHPIPPIVVNNMPTQDPAIEPPGKMPYYYPQMPLAAPAEGLRKPAQVQPMLFGGVGQIQHQPPLHAPAAPPPPALPYAPLQGSNPMYYMPTHQMLPQFRAQFDYHNGSRPPYGERFAQTGPKLHAEMPPQPQVKQEPVPAPSAKEQMLASRPVPTRQQLYPATPQTQRNVQRYSLSGLLTQVPGEQGFKTNFKPTQTKKNSNPKINMILSDKYDSKNLSRRRQRVSIEEPCLDTMYEHFRDAMNIDVARADITTVYQLSVQSELEEKLLDLFANNIATFIDIFLPHGRFQKIVSELALYDETRMILDSIFCLSSLILQRMNPDAIDPLCPLKYYQRSVNSIRYQLSLPEAENSRSGILGRCLLSTNLLCIYELFFIAIDSTYVKGAGSILMSILSKRSQHESLLKNSQFYDTCFWAMFICDLVLSLKLEAPSMYSLDRIWRPLDPQFFDEFDSYADSLDDSKTLEDSKDDYSSFIVSEQRTVWWLHKILLLFSAINLFCNLSDVVTREDYETNRQFDQWTKLNAKLEEFGRNMPVYLKPLIYKPATDTEYFPVVYFKDEQTAIVALNYKLARLSLHVALCSKLRIEDKSLIEPEILKYPAIYREKLARDIAGIMQTYDGNVKIWSVNIHALRQASKFFERGTESYEALKELTIRVIQKCQTGLTIPSFVESEP